MLRELLSAMGALVVLCVTAGTTLGLEARFDYGCEPRSSFCQDLTCTFDGSGSQGDALGYRWYFRRYLAEDRESEYATRSGVRVTHTYTSTRCRSYTYYATLEVTDSSGSKHSRTERVYPSRRLDLPPENQKPIADFAVACDYLACVFDAGASHDPDGYITSYDWNFGGIGLSGSGETALHVYEVPGTYTVRLTVADDEAATTSTWMTISVDEEPLPGFNLSATGRTTRGGRHVVTLEWTGADSDHVDVFRNGARIATVPNSGAYTDGTGLRGRATYIHQVCESGTAICSNETTVMFE